MTYQEIEEIKLEDITEHCFASSEFTIKTIEPGALLTDNENFYNSVEMIDKPTLNEVMGRFTAYKNQLKTDFFKDLKANPLTGEAFLVLNISFKNLWVDGVNKIYENGDSDSVSIFETELARLEQVKAEDDALTSLIAHGVAVKTVCDDTLNYITGVNSVKGLTSEQLDQIQLDFKDIEDALRKQRPAKAFGLISALVPSEHYDQLEIDALVAFLGGRLNGLSA